MRLARLLFPVLATACLGFALLPEGRLGCDDPMDRETSPDRAWTLTMCRRPMWFAMPGGSGGAPGWIVLREIPGAIRGVVDLEMVQAYRNAPGEGTQWTADLVTVPMVAELPLTKASGPVTRWLQARVWLWRARLGLVPTSDMFH